ncbi:acyltransferase family protein [Polynucleobacter ibericus]|uniref:acyltransferase family protein n=1 Tax=Polynucleobacter ibericus TaxID=1819725 RepID=UPI001BFD5129|nr:acyltransferase family protein [Polynucleobacter ibericus]QWE08977.1 acyltransferase [Polynucleobacter ibericus]
MSSTTTSNNQAFGHLGYRKDIDGLRALAVLLVVIYHAFPGWAHGGFIGVDIFFVISGYLITSIILDGLRDGSFSLVDFYAKRIIRIFPALILVMLISIGFGWLILYPAELQLLGKHILSAVGFFSNFTYFSESGYFDSRGVEKPLLHLWSLAIEEQFYLLWPVLLWVVYKLRAPFLAAILLLILGSFAWNIHLVHLNKSAAFYLPLGRFWELLFGALLALALLTPQSHSRVTAGKSLWIQVYGWFGTSSVCKQIYSILGLALLVVGVIVIYPRSLFPGWFALLPVVGASLMIYAGENAWINRYLLSNRLLVGIGLISYPLYLWHWVLLSFAQIWGPIFIEQRLMLVGASFVFAWLTYRLLEKPLRNRQSIRKKAGVLLLLMGSIFFIGLCLSLNGYPQRNVNLLPQFENTAYDGGDQGQIEEGCGLSDSSLKNYFYGCFQDKRESAKFALVGDSKAMALFPGLVRSSSPGSRWLTIYGPGGDKAIPPYLSNSRSDVKPVDAPYTDRAIDQIAKNPNIKDVALVFSSKGVMTTDIDSLYKGVHQAQAINGLLAITAKLVESQKRVVLVVDNPSLALPQDCFHRKVGLAWFDAFQRIDNRCEMALEKHQNMTAKYIEALKAVKQQYPHQVTIFDTTPILCDAQGGVCSYQKSGRKMYSYTDHISDFAAGEVGLALNRQLIDRSK